MRRISKLKQQKTLQDKSLAISGRVVEATKTKTIGQNIGLQAQALLTKIKDDATNDEEDDLNANNDED